MHFIGITGGVGAGKSAILEYLSQQDHCRVMLADEIAHEVMEPGQPCYQQLQALFSSDEVFLENGQFDRPKLAKVLFTDDKKREALNAIVHPAVKAYICREAELERKRGQLSCLILEGALLIEDGYDKICDELWYIYTSEDIRRARLRERRGYSDEKIDHIFKSQMTDAVFRSFCARVIDNNGSKEDVYRQIDEIWREYAAL